MNVHAKKLAQSFATVEAEKMEKATVFSEIWDSYKRTILHSIVTSFGLDFIIRDQNGGDVDTIHNVRETGQYKNAQNALDYQTRGDYDSFEYHGGNAFYREFKHDARSKFELDDAYFPNHKVYYGKSRDLKENPFKQASLDHVISAKEIHDDPGRVMAGLDGSDLANQEYNYAFTNASFNSSMGHMSIEEYIQWREDHGDPLPLEPIKALREKDSAARKEYERRVNGAYYTSSRFIADATKAATNLGVRMGLRQALGFVFLEVWFACEKEVKNLPSGVGFGSCLSAIKRGIQNGIESSKSKYKDILKQFGEGFVSGALASLGTTLINVFVTTNINMVKYIRQISVVVIQTGKILLINPDDLRLGDQLKAATVSIITGASVLAGTFIGNQIAKTPLGQHGVVGTVVQNFCSALVSGLFSCTILVLIDRSKFMRNLVERMNRYCSIDRTIRETSEAFIKMAAEIKQYDISAFQNDVERFDTQISKIQDADGDELNNKLLEIYEEFGIPLPWKGDFDSFMSNKNNKLVFE